MKLLSFQRKQHSKVEVGAMANNQAIVPLSQSGIESLQSMQSLIEAGEPGLAAAQRVLESATEWLSVEQIIWLPPLPTPVQYRDFAAFEEHMKNAGKNFGKVVKAIGGPQIPEQPVPPIWYKQPIYYKGNRFAFSGHQQSVNWPTSSRYIDYELEMACIIGRKGVNIPVSEARNYIFGFAILNDLTARDLQFTEMAGPFGPAKGKDFDGANALGPYIVTADEIPPHTPLTMKAYVNGELWSEGSTASIHWQFEDMIAHISCNETLYPGEIIGSGTVGRGCGLELGRFLQHNDIVKLAIDQLGSLETRIHAPHVTERATL